MAAGKLWEYYCQYPYMPRLTECPVLERGTLAVFDSLTWDAHGFALATGYDEKTGRYAGLAIPHEDPLPQLTDTTLLVQPPRALAQRDAERTAAAEAARAASRAADSAPVPSMATWQVLATVPLPAARSQAPWPPQAGRMQPAVLPRPRPQHPRTRVFYGTVRLNPERFGRDLNHLYQEVIQHLAAPDGVELEITVEIQAVNKDGYPDTTTRIVSENARTRKFDQSGFEDR